MRNTSAENTETILSIKKGGGRPRKLSPEQEEEVIKTLESNNFYSLQHVADAIKEMMHGIDSKFTICLTTVSNLLKRHGYRCLKAGSLPNKADPVKQRAFYNDVMLPILRKAQDESSNVVALSVDASHFVMGCDFLGRIWCKARRFLQTLSGRKRYNVLAALNW